MSFVTVEFAHCDFCNQQEQTFDGVPVGWATVTLTFRVHRDDHSTAWVEVLHMGEAKATDEILMICSGCVSKLFLSNDVHIADLVDGYPNA